MPERLCKNAISIMNITCTIREIQSLLRREKNKGNKIGFVPTMGALHEGHLSLIKCAKQENETVVVSIFVNPTQFNDREDYTQYPRNIDQDIRKLESYLSPEDMIFAPSVNEMYAEPDNRVFHFGGLDEVMEGLHRKGHFNGVAQIVSKLLTIIEPTRSYFGEKDYQQLVIIKDLVRQLDLPVEIRGCPLIRDADGLALSSRNKRLSNSEREAALWVPHLLFRARDMYATTTIAEIKQYVNDQVQSIPHLKLEYFEIADETQLSPLQDKQDSPYPRGFIAVYVDNIRLIDNVKFY